MDPEKVPSESKEASRGVVDRIINLTYFKIQIQLTSSGYAPRGLFSKLKKNLRG